MSNLSQFLSLGSELPPKSIINAYSTAASACQSVTTTGVHTKVVATGVLTAATLSTVLSLTGMGIVSFLAASSGNATSRTHRCKLTIDGTVVFDSTSAAIAVAGSGMTLIDQEGIAFNSSFLFEYASSLTETGLSNIHYKYRMS